jgi:hypothetical protein
MFDKLTIQELQGEKYMQKTESKIQSFHGIENRFYYWTQTRRLPQELRAG